MATVSLDDGTWRYTWPAGSRLLAELDSLVDVSARRVIDLGCGQGRLGLWAHAHGAATVVFADQSPAALAAIPSHPGICCMIHQWGDPLPACDLLLGGDILYRSALFPELMTSVASALQTAGSEALLVDPRSSLEDDLPRLASSRGLTWQSERRSSGYTLVRLRPVTSRPEHP
jgi:predicted nicotinamide N-methyase